MVLFDLPGVSQDEFRYSLRGRYLSIWGHRAVHRAEAQPSDGKRRWSGAFENHLLLPEGEYKPEANIRLEHGVLAMEFSFQSHGEEAR